METTGGVTSGYSRSGRRLNERMPKATRARLITVANTGRLTDVSDNHMALGALSRGIFPDR